jgi:hypothetical protein
MVKRQSGGVASLLRQGERFLHRYPLMDECMNAAKYGFRARLDYDALHAGVQTLADQLQQRGYA